MYVVLVLFVSELIPVAALPPGTRKDAARALLTIAQHPVLRPPLVDQGAVDAVSKVSFRCDAETLQTLARLICMLADHRTNLAFSCRKLKCIGFSC